MIYMIGEDGRRVIILEPDNIEHLKTGQPIGTPDGEVLFCYTPDIRNVVKDLIAIRENKTEGIDVIDIKKLIQDNKNAPEYHHPENMSSPEIDIVDLISYHKATRH